MDVHEFRLDETGDVVTFRWSSLEEGERRRIQGLLGVEVAEDGSRLLWGEVLRGTRLRLGNRRFLEGLETPERALPGHRCLKTANRLMQVPLEVIEGEEPVEKRESDVYSPDEGLERLLLRSPPRPDQADDYLHLARECAKMGVYTQAIDYLAMAKVLDPKVEDRTEDFRKELLLKHAETQARKLFEQICRDRIRGEYAQAVEHCEAFKRNFPNSELLTQIESMLPDVTEKKKVDLAKQVIFMYYTLTNDLIQLKLAERVKVDEQGRRVAAKPGKQITTKEGRVLRGVLVADTPEGVVLKQGDQGDLTLTVPRKSILTVQDVDLSKSHHQTRLGFDELRSYVTDAGGGLGRDITARIADTLKVGPDEVKQIFDGRLQQTAVYDGGDIKYSPVYASLRTAHYGKGSWLRGGGGLGTPAGTGSTRGGGRRPSQGGGQGGAVSSAGGNADQVNPEFSDDPEIWWAAQALETKFDILKAFAAEKLFRVKETRNKACPECGGKGYIVVNSGAGMVQMRCPHCRGAGSTVVVLYR